MYFSRRAFLQNLGFGAAAGLLAECSLHYSSPWNSNRSERVLLIGVDGVRPDALLKASTPHIDTLWENGAYSFNAQAGKHTLSGPGWSNILSGVWEDRHRVKSNNFEKHIPYPNLFSHLQERAAELNTVALVSWKPLHDYITLDADTRKYFPIDKQGDEEIAKATVKMLQEDDPHCIFSYFLSVDMAGHRHGFDPSVPAYKEEIEKVDKHVGKIMAALKKRPSYHLEDWLVMLVSDHGGLGYSHDGIEEAKIIPFIMHGYSVKKGEINPAPTQVDVVPTILAHMKIPVKPEWGLEGKVVGLK